MLENGEPGPDLYVKEVHVHVFKIQDSRFKNFILVSQINHRIQ